ncbi:MAG: hypothetical protein OES34_06670 [Nitrosopumilus sp.]|nr:hypothetical protein [Nitrosopumilus sp.]
MTNIALESEVWDKQFDLRDFAVEGQIWLTEPELVTWVGYTVQTTNRPPAKSWKVAFTGDNTAITSITGTMRVSNLTFVSEEEGYSWYNVRLESVDGAVAAA